MGADLFAQSGEGPSGQPQTEAASHAAPLAERLRPRALQDVVGQPQLIGPEGRLSRLLQSGQLPSLVLWGPPGCGKTTLARLLAGEVGLVYQAVSAIQSGVAELKAAFTQAQNRLERSGQRTLLFVDEIHRFNRAQQDSFLPVVERGTVVLVGATTENPSFTLNAALLSRCQVMVMERLDAPALESLLQRAEAALGRPLPLTVEARRLLCAMADGDGRHLLNQVEQLAALRPAPPAGAGEGASVSADELPTLLSRRAALYDKARDEHYNLISALHKSLRGSDPDAALYWFARMLEGGEDPRYIGRRLVRFASEDVGEADPTSLPLAQAGLAAYERLGSPEGELALAQVVVHLAVASKSNAVYAAYKKARALAARTGSLTPPAHILNAPTKLMAELGYGVGYAYDHDQEGAFSGQNYFPEAIERPSLYVPTGRGFEARIKTRLEENARLRAARQAKQDP
ncbi:replication-associated recombination protein A [Formicincola oecophyllae]|uniref:Replication-associated recombination protein A n=1 Tax=Formicincola oecophyllae TaxID=2558361 RepID=A0A4Y6UB05_9PROT|nr:replication-associated recombination protein A [Formicincola oecophyllae]QDH13758.1 replication-associated recombination protein A [Formicincola oecophyllae]